ncbi:tyrosine-type recombinase/integrase [Streptomyces graminifolii]|uniref:tyrosine-type recombinase/integrase n=1 Tax=Streptomyces graminifolii TaxID=1266771 RepID=UPI0040585416
MTTALTTVRAPVSEPTTESLAGAVMQTLQAQFPARPREDIWPTSLMSRSQVILMLAQPPFDSGKLAIRHMRVRGAKKLLAWLETFPGDSWQQRWRACPAETTPGFDGWYSAIRPWLTEHGMRFDKAELSAALLALTCADVIRQDLGWLLVRRSRYLRTSMAATRDPEGFAALQAAADPVLWDTATGQMAQNKVAAIMAAKGGGIRDITVGDCLELLRVQLTTQSGGGQGRSLFYAWLRDLGHFPENAPATFRNLTRFSGQVSVDQLVDRFGLQSTAVRNVIVDYLAERQSSLDYNSLEHLSRTLAAIFWADIERHHPGIDSLHLPSHVAAAWKERCGTKITTKRLPDGTITQVTSPRMSFIEVLTAVRAFYLDLALWAADDPARWGQHAVPCPIRQAETANRKKHDKQRKSRSDQRTRERLPVLPTLVRVVRQRHKDAQVRLEALRAAPAGGTFTALGETYVKANASARKDVDSSTRCFDSAGGRAELGMAEERAFWSWAAIEVFRHTGIRIEELLEISHHSIVQYRLPTNGELVPLLQITPSKTDEERLLLINPELADVLSTVVRRVQGPTGAVPLVVSYDESERVWNPPMPLLFQWRKGGQLRSVSAQTIRKCLNETLAATGLTDNTGKPLRYQPHDFRRIFITDAILNGLPPHIAQVIAGHSNINTTMGYNTVYPSEVIEAHRAFIARRRATRPGEEYRTPSTEEWDEFLGHFEKRKLAIGLCARAYGTDCIHEHACIRCSLLRPDTNERPRMQEIHDNLIDRIAEAEREGWLGEIEIHETSLAGAKGKLAQIDAELARANAPIDLGMPSFSQIITRTTGAEESSR